MTAVGQVLDATTQAAEDKLLSAVIMLDQTAAFDIVDHGHLLMKMRLLNFDTKTLDWFRSYLWDRWFAVQVESSTSEPRQLGDKGVPQGSILGSLLFVLSQVDLPHIATHPPTTNPATKEPRVQYVDDVTDVVAAKELPELLLKAEERATETVEWLLDNGMVLSLHKSMTIVQATKELRRARGVPANLSINVSGQAVKCVQSAKLLGIVINEDMTWESHLWGHTNNKGEKVPGLVCQLARTVGLLKKLSVVLPQEAMRSITMGLWQSRLLFGLALVGGQWLPETYLPRQWNHQATTRGDMEVLQKLQNQVMRVLLGKRDWLTPTEELLKACNMLSVHQLAFMATATAGYKSTTTGRPNWMAEQMAAQQHSRKNQRKVILPRTRTALREESLVIKATKAINIIPDEIKDLPLQVFKRELKKWTASGVPRKPP